MPVELSIIVPAYNTESYLSPCIESIMASTYQNFEVLLVDDGSTDGTGVLCDRFAEKYSKIRVFHTENRGLCAARNLGLEHASGKYIGFLDADDLISSDMLEALTSQMTDEVQMVACRFLRCKRENASAEGLSLQASSKTDTLGAAYKIMLAGYGCNVWNKIYRRSVLDEHNIRFRPDNPVAEDQYFLMDYLPYCKEAIFLDEQLYYYIMNDGSIMNTFRKNKCVPAKYAGLPRAWTYSAEVVQPLSKELEVYAQSRATMFYQTVLRKLEDPDESYIREAVSYVKRHKNTLLRYSWGFKYYLSALVLCTSYPFWKLIFRRGINSKENYYEP